MIYFILNFWDVINEGRFFKNEYLEGLSDIFLSIVEFFIVGLEGLKSIVMKSMEVGI